MCGVLYHVAFCCCSMRACAEWCIGSVMRVARSCSALQCAGLLRERRACAEECRAWCTVLQSVVHCDALYRSVRASFLRRRIEECCRVLQCVVVCKTRVLRTCKCRVMQCAALSVCCSVLQCVAVCCSVHTSCAKTMLIEHRVQCFARVIGVKTKGTN